MATTAQMTAWLTEAETAYHKLVTGTSARVVVDQNGERVEYTSANRNALRSYIEDLRRALGKTTVVPPMRVLI